MAFLAGPVGSWLRVWASVSLGLLLIDLQSGTSLDWAAYAIGGVVAVLPVVIAWLNPADPRFGRTGA